jgi:hypothetical protein
MLVMLVNNLSRWAGNGKRKATCQSPLCTSSSFCVPADEGLLSVCFLRSWKRRLLRSKPATAKFSSQGPLCTSCNFCISAFFAASLPRLGPTASGRESGHLALLFLLTGFPFLPLSFHLAKTPVHHLRQVGLRCRGLFSLG